MFTPFIYFSCVLLSLLFILIISSTFFTRIYNKLVVSLVVYICTSAYLHFRPSHILHFHFLHSHFNFLHRRRDLGESELTFQMLERNARRLKNGKFPKMPRSPHDIIKAFKDPKIFDRYALNLRKTKPFYIDTICAGTSHFTIFASHQVIDMIKKHIPPSQRNYLIDGTFKVTPIGGYYQLLIIHIECANDVSVFLCNEIIIHNVTVFFIKLKLQFFSGYTGYLCSDVR